MKVVLYGWEDGMKKVSLTFLQREILAVSLTDAKANVDALLEEKEIFIKVKSLENATKFVCEAKKIGVNCRLDE